ncbi:MAG: hypothetical protein ACREYE_00750 [Gammaproteobacteria bacterium]
MRSPLAHPIRHRYASEKPARVHPHPAPATLADAWVEGHRNVLDKHPAERWLTTARRVQEAAYLLRV